MTRVNVVLLLKPGKDPVDRGSYRPITLLQSDVKILAKVLALRVNGITPFIIHPDQAGFILQKSTAINLSQLFLNMQIPADDRGQKAICPTLIKRLTPVAGGICGRYCPNLDLGPDL